MAADDITIALGLPGVRVTQQHSEPERYDMWVESTTTEAVWPRCGQASLAHHDGYARTVRDIPSSSDAPSPCLCCNADLHIPHVGNPATKPARGLTGDSAKPGAIDNTSPRGGYAL